MFRVVFGAILGATITPICFKFLKDPIQEWVTKGLDGTGYHMDTTAWLALFFSSTAIFTMIGAIAGATQSIKASIRRYGYTPPPPAA